MKQEYAIGFPLVWVFFLLSLFLDIVSTRPILQDIREDGCIYGVWICYVCVFSLQSQC